MAFSSARSLLSKFRNSGLVTRYAAVGVSLCSLYDLNRKKDFTNMGYVSCLSIMAKEVGKHANPSLELISGSFIALTSLAGISYSIYNDYQIKKEHLISLNGVEHDFSKELEKRDIKSSEVHNLRIYYDTEDKAYILPLSIN